MSPLFLAWWCGRRASKPFQFLRELSGNRKAFFPTTVIKNSQLLERNGSNKLNCRLQTMIWSIMVSNRSTSPFKKYAQIITIARYNAKHKVTHTHTIFQKNPWKDLGLVCQFQGTEGVTRVLAPRLSPRKSPKRGRAAGTGALGPKRPSWMATLIGSSRKLLSDISESQASQRCVAELSFAKNSRQFPLF